MNILIQKSCHNFKGINKTKFSDKFFFQFNPLQFGSMFLH